MKVDNTTVGQGDTFGRNSVRIQSQKTISIGSLMIFDAVHLPFGVSPYLHLSCTVLLIIIAVFRLAWFVFMHALFRGFLTSRFLWTAFWTQGSNWPSNGSSEPRNA
jgi:hypothetical protein